MPRLRMLGDRIATADLRSARVPEKTAASIYHTPEYKQWRETIIANAGRRCEAVDQGVRCRKAEPLNRMFADHKTELQDGGAPFDPANGQCLCGAHHTLKTAAARAQRMRA